MNLCSGKTVEHAVSARKLEQRAQAGDLRTTKEKKPVNMGYSCVIVIVCASIPDHR